MTTFHQDLTPKRWFKMSIFEQMANVGSEVFRTISWRERDKNLSEKAFWRALELIDLTVDDPKNKKRLKEILRAREALCDFFVGDNQYHSTTESWNKYFYSFNYAARLHK
ncbi:MAG: hypothetical protein CEN92_448 [Candidatus Berkelbacteria bacterium Licking1014_96]|uniref:Uncharacterized protein n=1 Tax=Candidatus Berkelbacteria bacterium Licking1014_96 TaxID=2017149 RepID=A0A554LCF3_9BACT|nr:MAG: hypothetical protein CEN92_448 [Candidatus Berkelbacteria bacterium Licking1014_96]